LRPVNAPLALRAESNLSPTLVSAALVAGLMVAGLALRAAGLDETIYGDELFTHEVSSRGGLDDVVSGVASDLEISPPLYFVAAWATGKLGDPHVWLRMPALAASVATIPAVYLLGLRTVGRRAALAGAALFALSPFAVFYASEARAYSLATLFVVLSTLALLAALASGRRLHWGLFALAAWAALFSHYSAVFPLLAQAGWAAWAHRDRLRVLALSHAAVGVGLLPWLPEFLDDREAGYQTAIETFWPLTASFFFRSLGGWLAGNPYVGLTTIPGTAALVLLGVGFLVALAGARAAVAVLRRSEAALVVVLAVGTPLGAAAYSLVFDSVFVPRTLLAALPALCLALGLLLTSGPRPAVAAATALVIAGLSVGVARLVAWNPKPPFRDAAGHIDAATAPGDPVLEATIDFGTLEAELEPPFRLYKEGCEDVVSGPGQVLVGDVRCGTGRGGFVTAARAPARRAFVLTDPGRPQPVAPELERDWRLSGSRTFEHRYRPLRVLEYERR
jgi:Dolichyl-phosphate-mannose-protein mannosyltransferase